MYKAVFRAPDEIFRNFDIIYRIIEEDKIYYIESEIEGGRFFEKASLGSCGYNMAEATALLFAKRSVRPMHIEDIISDMHF